MEIVKVGKVSWNIRLERRRSTEEEWKEEDVARPGQEIQLPNCC